MKNKSKFLFWFFIFLITMIATYSHDLFLSGMGFVLTVWGYSLKD